MIFLVRLKSNDDLLHIIGKIRKILVCEIAVSLVELKKMVEIDDRVYYLLSSYYAIGLCVDQDLKEASKINREKLRYSDLQIGQAFLYDGIDLVTQYSDHFDKDELNKRLEILFRESLKYNYQLKKKDIDNMGDSKLFKLYSKIAKESR